MESFFLFFHFYFALLAWKFYNFTHRQKNFWFQCEFQIIYGKDFSSRRLALGNVQRWRNWGRCSVRSGKNHLTWWKYCANRKGIRSIYLSPASFPIRSQPPHSTQAFSSRIAFPSESFRSEKCLNPYQMLHKIEFRRKKTLWKNEFSGEQQRRRISSNQQRANNVGCGEFGLRNFLQHAREAGKISISFLSYSWKVNNSNRIERSRNSQRSENLRKIDNLGGRT